MSHSKDRKRNHSLYIEKWNPSAQKYIRTCVTCGRKGYSPALNQEDFCNTLENKAIYEELTKILDELEVDELGRCEVCARIQDNK